MRWRYNIRELPLAVKWLGATALSIPLLWFIFCLPKQLFTDPYSTVVESRSGELLAASIAVDGQWRFPHSDTIPDKFRQSLLLFEDEYFYSHPGVNPISICRAIKQNIEAKRVISGGSTITAQLMRMSQHNQRRTILQKCKEFLMALRVEMRYSKDELLAIYCSNAPFGGNVVGLETAAWRYYGRAAKTLSWAEAATLAVLPNAPALIHPGRNRDQLKLKRDRLLDKLYSKGVIDISSLELAKIEELPQSPKPMPNIAPHLLTNIVKSGMRGQRVVSTIDSHIQRQSSNILAKYHNSLSQWGVDNGAAIIIDVASGEIVSYVGNTDTKKRESGRDVDIVKAKRSTGSTLKPILYALMQSSGAILPTTLIPDIPTHISGYAPKNFDREFSGAEHANIALARSLNIPAVRMLRNYGLDQFRQDIDKIGIPSIDRPADHYGLSIILGGAEITLWELADIYSGMAHRLNFYCNNYSKYPSGPLKRGISYTASSSRYALDSDVEPETAQLSAASIWLTFQALTDMQRPMGGDSWRLFSSSRKVAWKTGTSFGHRDAWAVGVTPNYIVAVWVGNADGEGRSGLTGTSTAAPIMFDLFKILPQTAWFSTPYEELYTRRICLDSGYKAGVNCTHVDTIQTTENGDKTALCPYHKRVFLDANEQYQVKSDCYPIEEMVTKSWFVLPPAIEYYFKNRNPFYRTLPPLHPDCSNEVGGNIEIIYPKDLAKLSIPLGFQRERQSIIFEVAHRVHNTTLYWHLDGIALGSTRSEHKMELSCGAGDHKLVLVDSYGETLTTSFEVVGE